MRKLRVLALMHADLVPPDSIDGLSAEQIAPWKTEYDVVCELETMGHHTRSLGVRSDLGVIRDAIMEDKPHIVFNLLEEFSGLGTYVPFVLGYLELIKVPYSGCNPRGLILSDNKALMRKILKHHRIPMPDFAVFAMGRSIRLPRKPPFPLIVKSTSEHGSVGISQASIVNDHDRLRERIRYVHEHLETDAIAEEYIEGRELYMGVMGHHRLQTLPIWELRFEKLKEGIPRIATERVKWDSAYQRKIGLRAAAATELPDGVELRIAKLCKRVYRILGLSGYARMDLRLTTDGKVYLLEPNPNPDLSLDEEFAESAHSIGINYEQLIQRILNLGLRYHKSAKTA